MIHFDFNWSEPLNLLILALAIALLPMQMWQIFRKKRNGGFTSRDGVRLGLNVLLWLAVIAFIIQPYVVKEAKTVTGFLIGKDVPDAKVNALKDSLVNLKKIVSSDWKSADFDTLILAGQDFETEVFEAVTGAQALPKAIQWIPYFNPDQLESVHWRGIVKKGEMQVVHGTLASSKKQALKLTYGGETLDSIALKAGLNRFKLQFPVSTEGRTLIELSMDDRVLYTIRFFARPSEKLTFQFILDSPDFESRALANWLGKSGHSVIYSATLSKDMKSQQTINKAKDPDVMITDASNASNGLVKKALASGKSVLFINLLDPPSEIKAINSALGTRMNVSRMSAEQSIPVRPGLTALPFRFVRNKFYLISKTLPLAVEKKRGRVGVSLLNETFPLQLAGDSLGYQKVWDEALAQMLPAVGNHVEVKAPLFKGIHAEIGLNGFANTPQFIKLNADTLFTSPSSLNPKSAIATFEPTESGWISSNDSMDIEMFVENEAVSGSIYKTSRLTDFVKAYQDLQERLKSKSLVSGQRTQGVRRKLSDWMWFSVLILSFLAVWIERKL